jgi:very-short-patch-repair endonuclease
VLPYNARLKGPSRDLRKNMTEAESILWAKIRNKRIRGFIFYRQKPFGEYIVDFYCPRAKLVIELDGSQHFNKTNMENDKLRDEIINNLGFRVLRFTNAEVLTDIESVIKCIDSKIPLYPPLRKGENRKTK